MEKKSRVLFNMAYKRKHSQTLVIYLQSECLVLCFRAVLHKKKLHESTPINLSAPTANNRVKKKTQQNGGGRPAKPNWGNSVFQLL